MYRPPTSLFGDPAREEPVKLSVVLSALLHTGLITFAYSGVAYMPAVIVASSLPSRQVQYVELDVPLPSGESSTDHQSISIARVRSSAPVPSHDVSSGALPSRNLATGSRQLSSVARAELAAQRESAAPELELNPALLFWSRPAEDSSRIIAPPPSPQAVPETEPVFALPNQEEQVSVVQLASSPLPTTALIPAGTTSPLSGTPTATGVKLPETADSTERRARGGRVLVLSQDLQLRGPTPVPQKASGGDGATRSAISSARSASGGTPPASLAAIDSSTTEQSEPSLKKLQYPHDGSFKVVVVGTSLSGLYPIADEVWHGRLVYSVYLDVGLPTKWILQYAPLYASSRAASEQGVKLLPPWPLELLVPDMDTAGETLMIRGTLNANGGLGELNLASPEDFRYRSFLLSAIQQWTFKAAREGERPVPLDILLIIP